MRAGTVPVAEHRLGLESGVHVELLGDAEEQPARRPELVADEGRREDPDLELPLAHHHLGVGALNAEASLHARRGVALDYGAAGHLVPADAAVVRPLRRGEPGLGPPQGPAVLEEGVLLLNAEPRLIGGVLLGYLDACPAGVGGMWRHVGQQHLAHDELVVLAPQRVGADEHGLKHAVRVAPLGLVGARAVEAPDGGLLAVLHDLRLAPQQRARFGPVDPDVLGLIAHRLSCVPLGVHAGAARPTPVTMVAGPYFTAVSVV